MIDLITLNATLHHIPPACDERPRTTRSVPQFHPIPTLRILHVTFSGLDYNTGLEIAKELRKTRAVRHFEEPVRPALDSDVRCGVRRPIPLSSRRRRLADVGYGTIGSRLSSSFPFRLTLDRRARRFFVVLSAQSSMGTRYGREN
jgi:hypothetical protein